MTESTTIQCADCGGDYKTIRRNTKYCARCRLLRDLIFVGTRTANCWICQAEHAPLDRKDNTCGECSYQPTRHGITACAFCGQDALRVRHDVAVCHQCAHDPETRGRLIAALQKGARQRRSQAVAA